MLGMARQPGRARAQLHPLDHQAAVAQLRAVEREADRLAGDRLDDLD